LIFNLSYNQKKDIPMKRTICTMIFALFILLGCSEDFLDRPPMDSITIDNFYQTTAQVDAATALLYGWPWFTLNDKAHWTIGDSRAGNDWTSDGQMAQFFTFSVTSSNAHLGEAWVSLWMVVAHANGLINALPTKAGPEVPGDVVNRAMGEALFMRSVAYFYLVRLWGDVPIIENNSAIVFDSKIPKNRIEDVYTLIIRDLEQAASQLPPSYSGALAGRITSWAAKGMLAKVHLAFSGYNQGGTRSQDHLNKAKDLAGEVINNSGLNLLSNYADLFKQANNNNQESLFAFQWISCMDWGTQNTNQAYWAPSGTITGAGDGWGGYKGPTLDLQAEYEPGDARRKATFMLNDDVYPELRKAAGGYTFRFEQNSPPPTLSAIKKYVVGSAEDNGGPGSVCFMSTGINTYVLRLADVYLVYAEAILGNNGSTSDGQALAAFNAVRTRAGLAPKSEITWDDIRRERRIELAYESEYWYDLIRWHYYDPQGAANYISNQERGHYYWDGTAGALVLESRQFPITANEFYLPIPQGDSDSNPLLLQDPVPYNFGN
jgi:starch-binding outer membrane protein, SusD/RagB family